MWFLVPMKNHGTRNLYNNLKWALDEKLRRLFAANEAKVIGHGGITLAQKATVKIGGHHT